jgi:uncharacterized damage-inducible protein DinB
MNLSPSLSDRLHSQHWAIAEIIATINTARISLQPGEGKWSIHEHIAHLARYQAFFIIRIHNILTEEEPVFERYVAEADPEFDTYRLASLPALLQSLEEKRKELHTLLLLLTGTQLQRTGKHPKFGKLTIPDWVQFFLLHEAHHIFNIFKLAKGVE